LRQQILELVGEYYREAFPPAKFVPGVTPIPASGKVFDQNELQALVEAALDFWLTTGRFAARFERQFARFMGVRYAILVNSGSSANLLAVSCLTSRKLGERRLKPGDEVITVAAAFPTTVNPIIQNGLVPVFVDIEVPTYNVDVNQLEHALSDKTRAVVLAHTLGNPFNVAAVLDFVRRHDLWLIEDCCDAVGAKYRGQNVGTFGHLATVSFYPAHHITMGEGGAVLTNDPVLKRLVESFRDWGRDCWCAPGRDNTCGRRFDWQLGELPYGYDHKYIYSEIGYNLKATDLQAAVGLAQLAKLPQFIETRRRNFQTLYEGLRDLEDYFILPQATPESEPSWFGFPVAISSGAPLNRERVVQSLEAARIGTRLLFSGSLSRQPAYLGVTFRQVGPLNNTDFAMRQLFWVGVHPGLSEAIVEYLVTVLRKTATEATAARQT